MFDWSIILLSYFGAVQSSGFCPSDEVEPAFRDLDRLELQLVSTSTSLQVTATDGGFSVVRAVPLENDCQLAAEQAAVMIARAFKPIAGPELDLTLPLPPPRLLVSGGVSWDMDSSRTRTGPRAWLRFNREGWIADISFGGLLLEGVPISANNQTVGLIEVWSLVGDFALGHCWQASGIEACGLLGGGFERAEASAQGDAVFQLQVQEQWHSRMLAGVSVEWLQLRPVVLMAQLGGLLRFNRPVFRVDNASPSWTTESPLSVFLGLRVGFHSAW